MARETSQEKQAGVMKRAEKRESKGTGTLMKRGKQDKESNRYDRKEKRSDYKTQSKRSESPFKTARIEREKPLEGNQRTGKERVEERKKYKNKNSQKEMTQHSGVKRLKDRKGTSGSRNWEEKGTVSGKKNEKDFEETTKKNQKQLDDRKKNRNSEKVLCPVYKSCGGCQLLHMPYLKQLEQKKRKLEGLLEGICPVKAVIGMKQPLHYRNKVHAVFGHDKRGNAISGVYKEGTHLLIPIESCLIEDEKADEVIGTIRGMLKSFKIRTFDEDTGYGFLRHVLVKRGFSTGELMVVLVTASPVFPSKNNFVKALRDKHPEITTIIQNINGRNTSMVLGDKEHILYGKGYIEDELCGYRFRISSKSFYQVNPIQTEILYRKALELAGLTGKEVVLDAYCGIGTIGITASRNAGRVIGVELNQDAVRDAIQNAKRNQIENIEFYCNDAGRFLSAMAAKGERVDVVLMDPPRSGSTVEFIDAVAVMKPKRVIYISCGPETLARDLRIFRGKGYLAKEAWGVDMFPETGHCEVVVKIEKQ